MGHESGWGEEGKSWWKERGKRTHQSGVVSIYNRDGGKRSGPSNRLPSHDHGDQGGRKEIASVQGSLGCHVIPNSITSPVYFFRFASKQPRAFVLPDLDCFRAAATGVNDLDPCQSRGY